MSAPAPSMKIFSWNVNGIQAILRKCKAETTEFLRTHSPDVLCLQETKVQPGAEPRLAFQDMYPHQYWSSSVAKKGYSGTAILSREPALSARYGMGVPEHDQEGRLVTVEFATFFLVCSYVPNSGEGLKRLDYRRVWNAALTEYIAELDRSKPVLLVGDLNVAHFEIDLHNPKGNVKSAGFTPQEREDFTAMLARGFSDAWREAHPGVVGYTYWGYRSNAKASNRGWRIDYTVVSDRLRSFVRETAIYDTVLGSDHCPVGCVVVRSADAAEKAVVVVGDE